MDEKKLETRNRLATISNGIAFKTEPDMDEDETSNGEDYITQVDSFNQLTDSEYIMTLSLKSETIIALCDPVRYDTDSYSITPEAVLGKIEVKQEVNVCVSPEQKTDKSGIVFFMYLLIMNNEYIYSFI
jgi:hypothetical protein